MSTCISIALMILYGLYNEPEMLIAAGLFGIAAEVCYLSEKRGGIDED